MSLGIAPVKYVLRGSDALGNALWEASDYVSIDAARAVGSVGALTFTLPGANYDRDAFPLDGVIELWRHAQGAAPVLFLETAWFVRRVVEEIRARANRWRVTAYDGLFLLGDPDGQRGRIVAYNAANAYTSKLANAGDLIKAVVRENAGTLATDTARDLSAYLAVEADKADGASVRHEFARRVVLDVCQEVAQMSTTAGSYLAFDVVCVTPPSQGNFALEFRTYAGQRGQDRRVTSGQPVLIGPDFGNLVDAELDEDATAEENYIYAGGQGVADVRAVATATDSTRTGLSPFNRREAFKDARETFDATALADIADHALRAGRPRRVLTGKLLDTDQARFGRDWGYGDYLSAQASGYTFSVRADALALKVTRGAPEDITALLRGEHAG